MTLTSDSAVAIGDVCFINSSGHAQIAKADVIGDANGLIMATQTIAASGSGVFLVFGTITSAAISLTAGSAAYLSTVGTTGNTLTATAPSGAGNVIQFLGWAMATNSLFFHPCLVQVVHV